MVTKEQSKKLPAFQFYPGDWKRDFGIQSLDYETRGIWFEIILILHESEERGVLLLNGKPMPIEALARALGLDKQKTTTTITKLLDYGVASLRPSDQALYSRRMVKDEQIRQTRARCGIMGGNPNLLNQKVTTKVKQKPTPSSSSSSSSSSSDKREMPALQQLSKFLRMTSQELQTLESDFGRPLVDQELREAEIWIENAQTPNARKYRKPEHNHYLFMRNWLKDKRLRSFQHPAQNGRQSPLADYSMARIYCPSLPSMPFRII